LSMSSSSTTCSPAKISTYAIRSNGGLDVVLCSLISFFLSAISSRSLVRPLESTAFFFSYSPFTGRFCCRRRAYILRWLGHHFSPSHEPQARNYQNTDDSQATPRLARIAVKEMIGGT
jgi:hypothetical protein